MTDRLKYRISGSRPPPENRAKALRHDWTATGGTRRGGLCLEKQGQTGCWRSGNDTLRGKPELLFAATKNICNPMELPEGRISATVLGP